MADGVPGPGGALNHPTLVDRTGIDRWGEAYTPTLTLTAGELTEVRNNPNSIPRVLSNNPGFKRQDIRAELSRSPHGSGA